MSVWNRVRPKFLDRMDKILALRLSILWWFGWGLVLTVLNNSPFVVFTLSGWANILVMWPWRTMHAPWPNLVVSSVVLGGSLCWAWTHYRTNRISNR